MKTALYGAAVIMLAVAMTAQAEDSREITFTKDILPILQENCQVCHRPNGANYSGMVAPMAFMTYEEVRPWAKAIARKVVAREMPPWHAASIHAGQFANERTLTDEEIATISRWVDTGAKRGRPEDAPAPIEWPDGGSGWSIGEPDLIVRMPEPYFIADEVEDLYINFEKVITKEELPRDQYIKAVEFKAGSPAVHHVIAPPLGGMAPGNDPNITPEGFGRVIRAGDRVEFQMHYHKEAGPGTGVWDQTEIGVTFHPPDADIKWSFGGGPANIGNTWFEIPPGHPNWAVGASHVYERDTLILGFMPHMHVRGKDMTYTAYYPDGTSEVLLSVPKYDFNWQTSYRYKEPKWIPAGTRLEVVAHFDNSTNNPSNPNPNKAIRFGGPTTDEMMLGWLTTSCLDPAEPLNQGTD